MRYFRSGHDLAVFDYITFGHNIDRLGSQTILQSSHTQLLSNDRRSTNIRFVYDVDIFDGGLARPYHNLCKKNIQGCIEKKN